MNGLCYYELKSRFHGLFNRLPWTYFVTASLLLPIVILVENNTRALLIELMIYWALVISVIWLLNDLCHQKMLQEFAFDQRGIYVKKKDNTFIHYTWDCLTAIDSLAEYKYRCLADGKGVSLRFDDGYTLKVFSFITNYKLFCQILNSKMMQA